MNLADNARLERALRQAQQLVAQVQAQGQVTILASSIKHNHAVLH